MTKITISVPDDLPEGEKRRSIESEVETKLSKHEEEARLNDYLRDLYHKASKDTGKEIESTDDGCARTLFSETRAAEVQ